MTTFLPTGLKVLAGALALGAATLFTPGEASAQWGGSIGYNSYAGGYGGLGYSNYGNYGLGYGNRGYSYNAYRLYNGPIYHAPSVHYDRVYHSVPHWTPGRGWHTHTHSHVVPHYVPGHFDHLHGDHIHKNPNFHHGHDHD
jgi:hypothetical protein